LHKNKPAHIASCRYDTHRQEAMRSSITLEHSAYTLHGIACCRYDGSMRSHKQRLDATLEILRSLFSLRLAAMNIAARRYTFFETQNQFIASRRYEYP
jgi:hypothetical protein